MTYHTSAGRRVETVSPVRRKAGGLILVREVSTGDLFYTREASLTPG